ncbi:MAG TPA: group I intron-associated PD-(D/E)XK endonuclease [Terriglobales bacterium]|nr:group I intron-associated PD-(D/E)XK endonuclease [Terriglobales bacterium]
MSNIHANAIVPDQYFDSESQLLASAADLPAEPSLDWNTVDPSLWPAGWDGEELPTISACAASPHETSQRRKGTKRRGDIVELELAVLCMKRGLIFAKPYGDSYKLDCIVAATRRRGHKMRRVQVRSLQQSCGNNAYCFSLSAGNPKRAYRRGDFDILAGYVSPHDAWYFIPLNACAGRVGLWVYPHVQNSTGMFERYRNRWDLLE